MNMHRTPKYNIDKQQLKNPISENIDLKKRINWWYRSFEIGKNEFP